MDITLSRILSLLQRKENGEIAHGARKEFALSIGLRSGNLISDWENGRSTSYTRYLYEIADKYNVSVEWLKGETDDPTKIKTPTVDNGEHEELIKLFEAASPELRAAALAVLRTAEKKGD